MSKWFRPNFNTPVVVREVPITELPNRWRVHLEGLVEDPSTTSVMVVLANNGKAYIGYPALYEYKEQFQGNPVHIYHADQIQTPEQIARLGNLLDAKEAVEVFGEINHD